MTTAIYARYSSHSQDEGTSIEVQLDACRRAAGGTCVEYVDKAKTGRAIGGRAALLRLLDDAEKGKIGRLLVHKYDRLGRSSRTHAIVADLEDLGVEVISVTEGKDVLTRGVQLVVAEHYSRVLAERTRDGLLKRFEQGAWTGGPPPYGYKIVGPKGARRLAIDEGEAEAVRAVYDAYMSQGLGFKELARCLGAKGVPTRKGGPWTFTSVKGILSNPIVVGKVRYNRRKFKLNHKTGRRVPVFKDGSQHLCKHDESLRIISDEKFGQVQERIAKRARRRNRPRPSLTIRPFTRLVYCENGHPCYCRRSKNHKGEYAYYSCSARQRVSKDACEVDAYVREDLLLRAITESFMGVFEDVEAIVQEAVSEAEKLVQANRDDARRLHAHVADLDRRIASVTDLLTDPAIEDAAKRPLSRQLGEAETQREEAQSRLHGLAEEAGDTADKLTKAVRQALGEARDSLGNVATAAQLHEFMERFVGPMVLHADGSITQKQTAPDDAEAAALRNVAGAGFEPATSGL